METEAESGANTDVEHAHPEDAAADARADIKGLLVIFGALILMAVHFASQWTFDWTYDLF